MPFSSGPFATIFLHQRTAEIKKKYYDVYLKAYSWIFRRFYKIGYCTYNQLISTFPRSISSNVDLMKQDHKSFAFLCCKKGFFFFFCQHVKGTLIKCICATECAEYKMRRVIVFEKFTSFFFFWRAAACQAISFIYKQKNWPVAFYLWKLKMPYSLKKKKSSWQNFHYNHIFSPLGTLLSLAYKRNI